MKKFKLNILNKLSGFTSNPITLAGYSIKKLKKGVIKKIWDVKDKMNIDNDNMDLSVINLEDFMEKDSDVEKDIVDLEESIIIDEKKAVFESFREFLINSDFDFSEIVKIRKDMTRLMDKNEINIKMLSNFFEENMNIDSLEKPEKLYDFISTLDYAEGLEPIKEEKIENKKEDKKEEIKEELEVKDVVSKDNLVAMAEKEMLTEKPKYEKSQVKLIEKNDKVESKKAEPKKVVSKKAPKVKEVVTPEVIVLGKNEEKEEKEEIKDQKYFEDVFANLDNKEEIKEVKVEKVEKEEKVEEVKEIKEEKIEDISSVYNSREKFTNKLNKNGELIDEILDKISKKEAKKEKLLLKLETLHSDIEKEEIEIKIAKICRKINKLKLELDILKLKNRCLEEIINQKNFIITETIQNEQDMIDYEYGLNNFESEDHNYEKEYDNLMFKQEENAIKLSKYQDALVAFTDSEYDENGKFIEGKKDSEGNYTKASEQVLRNKLNLLSERELAQYLKLQKKMGISHSTNLNRVYRLKSKDVKSL